MAAVAVTAPVLTRNPDHKGYRDNTGRKYVSVTTVTRQLRAPGDGDMFAGAELIRKELARAGRDAFDYWHSFDKYDTEGLPTPSDVFEFLTETSYFKSAVAKAQQAAFDRGQLVDRFLMGLATKELPIMSALDLIKWVEQRIEDRKLEAEADWQTRKEILADKTRAELDKIDAPAVWPYVASVEELFEWCWCAQCAWESCKFDVLEAQKTVSTIVHLGGKEVGVAGTMDCLLKDGSVLEIKTMASQGSPGRDYQAQAAAYTQMVGATKPPTFLLITQNSFATKSMTEDALSHAWEDFKGALYVMSRAEDAPRLPRTSWKKI